MEQPRPIKRKAFILASATIEHLSEVPLRLKREPMPPLTQEAQEFFKEYEQELAEVQQKVERRHARQKKAAKILKSPLSKKVKKQSFTR